MLAEYLHHQSAFRLVRLVLKLDFTSLYCAFATTNIRSRALEDRLQSFVVNLACEPVATSRRRGGLEGVAGEEGLGVESERCIRCSREVQSGQGELFDSQYMSLHHMEYQLCWDGNEACHTCLLLARFDRYRFAKLGKTYESLVYAYDSFWR